MESQSTASEVIHILLRPENRVWGFVITSYFLTMLFLLLKGHRGIKRDLSDAIAKIKGSGFYLRSEASKEKSFSHLDSILENNQTLQHSWHEFKEGLVCEIEEFEMNGVKKNVRVYKNAIEAEQFFNFDSVVINSERWIFGIKFGMFDSVPNILTGLGIFGTFVGIVVGLPATLQGDIAQHMEEFIRGMRVAFGTSILGLLFSLIFTFIDKWIHDHLEQCINKISSDIDFLFIRKSQQEYLHTIAKEVKSNSEAIAHMSDGIGQKVAQGFQSLGIDSVQVNESIKQGIQDGMQKLSDNLNEILVKQEKLHASAEQMIGVVNTLKVTLEMANEGIKGQHQNVVASTEGVSKLTESMTSISQQLLPQLDQQLNLSKDLVIATQSLGGIADKLNAEKQELMNSFVRLNESVQLGIKDLSTSFDIYQNKSSSAIEGNLQAFDKELAKGVQRLSGVLVDMSGLGQEILKIHDEIKRSFPPPIKN